MGSQKKSKDTNSNYELVFPNPSALVESLRAFGYSLDTAIADLIDNSIVAKAKNIWINFEWNGADSKIIIKDDGYGMTESELTNAMRPGSQNPLEERSPEDLGRFGLGLKTASFSQCRRLSVISKKENDSIVARCWDLDYINQHHEWRLLKLSASEINSLIKESLSSQGTVIIWQELDRITGNVQSEDNKAYSRFLKDIEGVKRHLKMVFHRYLEKPNGLKIWINENPLKPWDPFLRSEKATQEFPLEKIACKDKELKVIAYILPHKSKMSDDDIHQRAAGPNGWNAQQGFYVYRNERLLVGGDWLGLGFQKEEHYKLARIQVDLPNSMDGEWQIDVKKSRAKPPGYIRHDLKKIASLAREKAVDVYRHRGKVVARGNAQNHVFLWEQKVRGGKYYYAINREHPLVQEVYRTGNKEDLNAFLYHLEETIPINHMLLTHAKEPEKLASPYENLPSEAMQAVLRSSFKALLNSGVSTETAKVRLAGMDPFDLFPDFVNSFLNELAGET